MKKTIAVIASIVLILLSGCSRISTVKDPSSLSSSSVVSPEISESITPPGSSTFEPSEPSDISSQISSSVLPVSDPEITSLQNLLKELGYFSGEITGLMDDATVSALEHFQKNNGIDVTGRYDKDTIDLINSGKLIPNEEKLPLSGLIIGIDPGHQRHGNSDLEPVAPGSDVMKKKVSSGTQGKWTRTPEWEVNLKVGLRLKELLENAGATVIITHDSPDVDISNVERAQMFNDNNTDYALRLHCNGNADETQHGAFMLIPKNNPFYEDCVRAAEILLEEYCTSTGAYNRGLTYRSDQSGFNWCDRMIINIEMGYMSNEEEDHNLSDPDYQEKMAQGLFKGILRYFNEYRKDQTEE